MARLKANQMTNARVGALVALWDAGGHGTAYKLKQTRGVLDALVDAGMATRRVNGRLNVGKGKILYSLSDKGKRELELTGNRVGPKLVT